MKFIKFLSALLITVTLFSCSSDSDSSSSSESASLVYNGQNIPVTSWQANRSGNFIAVALYGNDGTAIDFKFNAFGNLYKAWTFSTTNFDFPNRNSFTFDSSQTFTFEMVELNESNKTIKVNFSGKTYDDDYDINSDFSTVQGSFVLHYTDVDTALSDYGTFAKINNQDWHGLSMNLTHTNWTVTEVHVDSDDKNHLHLVVPYQAATVGNYTFNSASEVNKVVFERYDAATNELVIYETAGAFNITEVTSSIIKGTFTGTATSPVDGSVISITNGSFKEAIN